MSLIDGIVLTDSERRNENIERLAKLGVEPRKIILWNNRGIIEFFNAQDSDGSLVVFMEGLQFHIRNEDDAKFFNQIHSWIQTQRQFYAVPPKFYPQYIAQQYEGIMQKPLDWDNLQTWTEKMQWIKLYDSTPIKTRLADKFLVRQWITEKIGDEYLIPLYGVWNNFDEIEFDSLPNQFVLKCNHGSGMNIICRDKESFDFENAREKLTAWLNFDYGTLFFEAYYSNIKRKIIAEEFMTDGKNFDLITYKIWCFDGNPLFFFTETNRSTDRHYDYFDINWNHLDFEQTNYPNSEHYEKIPKPKNLELMKETAAILSQNFANVRVDFLEIEGRVYFSEMTFINDAGIIGYKSEGTDEYLGDLVTLPTEKYKFWER